MTRFDRTPRRRRRAWLLGMACGVVALVAGYALLEGRSPGDSAEGFLTGGLAVLLLACVGRWRAVRRAGSAGTVARASGGLLDERDDHVLTHTLAIVGFVALLASAVASGAVMLGADARIVVGAMPFVLLATLAITFVVVNRRS